jgi:hypothetical protein
MNVKEVRIKRVSNGFVVDFEVESEEGWEEKTMIFTRFSQVAKFMRENFKD